MFMTNQPTRPPKRTSLRNKGLIRPFKGKAMVSKPYQTLASGEGLGCLTTVAHLFKAKVIETPGHVLAALAAYPEYLGQTKKTLVGRRCLLDFCWRIQI